MRALGRAALAAAGVLLLALGIGLTAPRSAAMLGPLWSGPVAAANACGMESAPTRAADAGFTTCAANFDFSQPTYAVGSNWLDCSSTNGSLPWHWGYVGVIPSYNCASTIFQMTDPTYGNKVLDIYWLNSYGCTLSSYFGCSPGIQTVTNGCASNCTGLLYPPNFYAETDFRIDETTQASPYAWYNDVWSWQNAASGSGSGAIEYDLGELNPAGNGSGDGAVHNWSGDGGGGFTWTSWGTGTPPSGWSVTAYHSYGMLVTSDGASATYACSWIDATLQTCVNVNAGAAQYGNHTWLVMFGGGCANNSGSGACQPNTNMYVEYYRVWACASWNRGVSPADECNGTALYNSGGLTYWH